MTLPDFLIIGAQRAGTTWLDGLLRTHPDIYMPPYRKDIHFFDRYYERGRDWYEGFVPGPDEASRYAALGESTPRYLYDPSVPPRIAALLPACRLVAILQDPVDRDCSQDGHSVKDWS